LVVYVGGSWKYGERVEGWAGANLKSTSSLWRRDNEYNTDAYGFSALLGGSRYSDGSFYYVGYYGNWWTAMEYNAEDAYSRDIYYGNEFVGEGWYIKRIYERSVRCLRDD
jgi:uncharacterized protein (TIGR02145 family)